jgi:hypothetical protein
VNPQEFVMHKKYGSHAKPPILLIQGGAGLYKDSRELLERKRRIGLVESVRNPTPNIRSVRGKVWVSFINPTYETKDKIEKFCRIG